MLETRPLIADVGLGPREFRKAMLALDEQGWTPAVVHSEREFLRLAGVDQDTPLRAGEKAEGLSAPLERASGSGEVFFRGEDLYYCVCRSRAGRMMSESGDGNGPAMEVGLISRKAPDIDKRVRTFAGAVEMAVRRSAGGAKAQAMTFDWHEPKLSRSRLVELEKPGGAGKRFAEPVLGSELVGGAEVLAEPPAREILAELVLAGFLRTRDILAGRRADPEAANLALDKLRRARLITPEHLLECRKYGTALTRLSDSEKLQTPEVGGLVCPSCGARFSEESLCEGFSPSDLGRRLSRNAHWLTVLTLNKLVQLGVPGKFMLWNVSHPEEGVDVAVQFLGRFWTFELKDREFAAQDVPGFDRRRRLNSPQKAFAVSAEKIAPGAKRLFEELSGGSAPACLAGLEKMPEVLRREVHEASLAYACGRLRVIENLTGYDLGRVVAARFAEKSPPVTPHVEPVGAPPPGPADKQPRAQGAKLARRAAPQNQ